MKKTIINEFKTIGVSIPEKYVQDVPQALVEIFYEMNNAMQLKYPDRAKEIDHAYSFIIEDLKSELFRLIKD